MTRITARFGATPRQPAAPDTLSAHDEDRLAALMAEDARACAKRAHRHSMGWASTAAQAESSAGPVLSQAQRRQKELAARTHHKIAEALAKRGACGIAGLAEALGRSRTRVSQRLSEMEQDGRVTFEWRLSEGRRWVKAYRLTEGEG